MFGYTKQKPYICRSKYKTYLAKVEKMKIIRNINFTETLRTLEVGEFVVFPYKDIPNKDISYLRSLCVRMPGKYSSNKVEEGLKVTRLG